LRLFGPGCSGSSLFRIHRSERSFFLSSSLPLFNPAFVRVSSAIIRRRAAWLLLPQLNPVPLLVLCLLGLALSLCVPYAIMQWTTPQVDRAEFLIALPRRRGGGPASISRRAGGAHGPRHSPLSCDSRPRGAASASCLVAPYCVGLLWLRASTDQPTSDSSRCHASGFPKTGKKKKEREREEKKSMGGNGR